MKQIFWTSWKEGQQCHNIENNGWTIVASQIKSTLPTRCLCKHQSAICLSRPKKLQILLRWRYFSCHPLLGPFWTLPFLVAVFTWSDCIRGRGHIWRPIHCGSEGEPSGQAFVQVLAHRDFSTSEFWKPGLMVWRPSSLVAISLQWPNMTTRGWSGRWVVK